MKCLALGGRLFGPCLSDKCRPLRNTLTVAEYVIPALNGTQLRRIPLTQKSEIKSTIRELNVHS